MPGGSTPTTRERRSWSIPPETRDRRPPEGRPEAGEHREAHHEEAKAPASDIERLDLSMAQEHPRRSDGGLALAAQEKETAPKEGAPREAERPEMDRRKASCRRHAGQGRRCRVRLHPLGKVRGSILLTVVDRKIRKAFIEKILPVASKTSRPRFSASKNDSLR